MLADQAETDTTIILYHQQLLLLIFQLMELLMELK
jgi:hypothetical protein